MNETPTVKTTFYLTLTPEYARGSQRLKGIATPKVTKTKPTGQRLPVVKLTIELPAAAFDPLTPEVTIALPADALVWPEPTITVEANPEGANQ